MCWKCVLSVLVLIPYLALIFRLTDKYICIINAAQDGYIMLGA